jgi:hypothetical protein
MVNRERSVLYVKHRYPMARMSARQEAIACSKREPIMRVLPGLMLVILLGRWTRRSWRPLFLRLLVILEGSTKYRPLSLPIWLQRRW